MKHSATQLIKIRLQLSDLFNLHRFRQNLIFYIDHYYNYSSKKSKLLTFSQRQILDSSKLKEFADDNFKFGDNGRTFFKRVENTVGKGVIAHNEQYLLFPQCFQMTCTADTLKPGLVWERVIK